MTNKKLKNLTRNLSLPLIKFIFLVSPLLSASNASAYLTSMKFPDAHGNSMAVAVNSKNVIVGTDYGYLEVIDRETGNLKSIQIYKGPYRPTTAVALDDSYAYAVVSGYSIVKVDLTSAQVIDELKVSRDFDYINSFQLFGSTAFVNGYSDLKPVLFKLTLNRGKLSESKREIVSLPFTDYVYQLHMTSEDTGLAIVGKQRQLAKFNLVTQTANIISLSKGIYRIIAVANDIAFLSGKDNGSTESTDDVYLALDLLDGHFVLPFSENPNHMAVSDFEVNESSIFIASWNEGLVVLPAPSGYQTGSAHPALKQPQPFPSDLFQSMNEKTPESFYWSCESITQYGIPAEWKIDFGISSPTPAGSDQKSNFTILIAQRDWLKNDGIHYFKRYETGTVHNDDGEFTVGFSKPGGQPWDFEGVLSGWMNHAEKTPLEIKIWLQNSPSIASSAINLKCIKKK